MKAWMKEMLDALGDLDPHHSALVNAIKLRLSTGRELWVDRIVLHKDHAETRDRDPLDDIYETPEISWIPLEQIVGFAVEFNIATIKDLGIEPTIDAVLKFVRKEDRA